MYKCQCVYVRRMEKNCFISSFLMRATHSVLSCCVAACIVHTSTARPRLLVTVTSNRRSSSLFTTSRRPTWFICTPPPSSNDNYKTALAEDRGPTNRALNWDPNSDLDLWCHDSTDKQKVKVKGHSVQKSRAETVRRTETIPWPPMIEVRGHINHAETLTLTLTCDLDLQPNDSYGHNPYTSKGRGQRSLSSKVRLPSVRQTDGWMSMSMVDLYSA